MVPPASGGAQTFSDSPYGNFSNAMDQTYDGEDEAPVYRSLCVAAPLAPPMLGGYQPDMAMGLMGGQSEFYSQTKPMASKPSDQDSCKIVAMCWPNLILMLALSHSSTCPTLWCSD
jgi:hypothetical protein